MAKILFQGPPLRVNYFLEGEICAADVLLVFEFFGILFVLGVVDFYSIKLTHLKFELMFHILPKNGVTTVFNRLSSAPQTFLLVFVDLINDAKWISAMNGRASR